MDSLLLTVEQAAQRTSLSRAMIYRLMQMGEIGSIKIGAARRIPTSALDDWIARKIVAAGTS